MELINELHKRSVIVQEIKFPIRIEIIEWLILRFDNPAIKLLDHTPVSGNGNDENPHKIKHF